MFKKNETFSSFSVSDLKKTKEFYEKKLSLKTDENNGLLNLHITDNSSVMIYPKPNHSPASFTVLNFKSDNIDKSVEELNQQGIKCIIYNESNIKTDEKGILRDDYMNIAWFKDPAGNILSVIEEKK